MQGKHLRIGAIVPDHCIRAIEMLDDIPDGFGLVISQRVRRARGSFAVGMWLG